MEENDCVIPYLPFGNHLALRGTEDTHNKLAALKKDHPYTKAKSFQCDESCYKCAQQDNWEKPFDYEFNSYELAQNNALKESTISKIRSCKLTHKSNLHVQNKHFHDKNKTLQCTVHSYKSKQEQDDALKVSIPVYYTREDSTECRICNCKFTNASTLRVHNLRFHRDYKTLQCAICSYKCKQEGDLNKHLRIHSGDKPFGCHFCDYKCTQKHHLKMHLKVHSDEKPLECILCNCKFTQKPSFLAHNLRFHSEVKPFLV